MERVPDHTKWSEVDSYLHKKIRELRDDVDDLKNGRTRVLVNEGVSCSEFAHIFPVGGGPCLCGQFGGPSCA